MDSSDRDIWPDILAYMRRHHPGICRHWFDEIEPLGMADGAFRARVSPESHQRYLMRECGDAFDEAVQAVTGRLVTVRFELPEAFEARATKGAAPSAALANGSGVGAVTPSRRAAGSDSELFLSPDYTFDNFIIGPENRMAHAAAQAVCAQPGKLYNPLFIHGGVGLGKTHLLQAVCHRLLQDDPSAVLHYTSCEGFITAFVDAVKSGQMHEFRERFRSVDILVIDDIHFLATRDSSQEEFFHTFNALYQHEKQIVLSSDAPPAEIPDLEARLVSRFQCGLVVHVSAPCFDTRMQIVLQKAKLRGLEMPEEAARFIAARGFSNIRELEGALGQVQLRSTADQCGITVELAREALGEAEEKPAGEVTITSIIDSVVDYYSVKLTDLQSKRRHKSIAHPRQVCMYLARKHTRYSLEEIGGYFGGRDHTTVMHAVRTIDHRRSHDPDLSRVIDVLEERVRPAARAS